MKTILNIVKTGLKGDKDIEIDIPLNGNPQNNKFQSNVETSNEQLKLARKTDKLKPVGPDEHSIEGDDIVNDSSQSNQASSQNAIPNTEIVSNQENVGPPNQYPGPINIWEKMKKDTDKLKIINNYHSENEKRDKIFFKQDDEQEIIYKRNRLSRILPTPLTDDVIIPNRFPLNVLPEPFQNLIKSIAHYLSVPVEAVCPALIAAILIACRGKFKILVKSGYLELLTEYFIIIQHSGENKSAIVAFFRSVIDEYFADLQAEYDKNSTNNELISEAYKKSKNKLMKDLTKEIDIENSSEINNQITKVIDTVRRLEEEMPKKLYRPTPFSDTPTLKKLAEIMSQQNEFIAIFEAEAGIWKHRVRSNEDTILLKAYTMEPFSNETSTNGSVIMESPTLVICSYIQPAVAEKLFSKEDLHDDGLLPRILSVFIPRNKNVKNANPVDVPTDLIKMYEDKIKSILQYTFSGNNDDDKRQIYTLNLTQDAYAVFVDYKQKINLQMHDKKFKNCEAFASKLAGHAVRLAGAVHFLQHDKPWEKSIDSSAMAAGIAIADFFAVHAKSFFDNERIESIKYANKILDKIKAKRIGPLFSQRDAQRAVGHCNATQISSGLNLLEQNHFLCSHTELTNKVRFIVNPRIVDGSFDNLIRPSR